MKTTNQTACVRAGVESDSQHGAVIPPIHLSTTYSFRALGQKRQYDYTRSGNPTRDLLGDAIADLEGGAGAVITSSGMSAIHLVAQLLDPGDTILVAHDCYGGSHRLFRSLAARGLLNVDFVDLTAADVQATIAASKPKIVWVETPSNPLLRVTDIRHVSNLCDAAGALLVVDNTFLSPALQRPFEHGADIVVHSTTKYLNGHSDVVGGAVVARDSALLEKLAWWGNCLGLTGAPFDSYLTLRGVRTLHARVAAHTAAATAAVEVLDRHPLVQAVFYPGLPTHEGHDIAARQQDGFGAMISFELLPGLDLQAFVDALSYFSLAESLGGVESLIAHPASMTHAAMGAEGRAKAGISDTLLRLSVGIERPADLAHDLEGALDALFVQGRVTA